MFKFVVFFAAITCAFGATIPVGMAVLPEGVMHQLDGRIIGGTNTTINFFPWQVSIQRNGFHFCGGAIYNNRIIVTAAHCLQNLYPASLKVRAGSSYWNFGGVLLNVAAYRNHEGYNPNTKDNDIAVVRLSETLRYGATIKAINLTVYAPQNGAAAFVSGWGRTVPGYSSTSTQLLYINTKIVSRVQCASSQYRYGGKVYGAMICAAAAKKDACQGDSGGAMVSGGVLVGIVSWGVGCAETSYPGVYADVAALRPWVQMAAASV